MFRTSIIFAAFSGLIAVILGAFGTHALKNQLAPGLIDVWHTAVLYQFIHTLALLIVANLGDKLHPSWTRYSLYLFMFGIILFSGSLYCLVLIGLGKLGMVTPIGGLCFILAWLCLAIAALKK
ncbi:membrane protein [Pelistega indica]|uniref:Membrane protein n=1 Tax=Pelistega indica TaxID=1414851 RepID=V8GAA4_9BURK|nr:MULTISPECIES: DUF423 domain-containing protein [Pelistega]ETD73031.1 membrane protein [Pelistega indica]